MIQDRCSSISIYSGGCVITPDNLILNQRLMGIGGSTGVPMISGIGRNRTAIIKGKNLAHDAFGTDPFDTDRVITSAVVKTVF